MAEPTIFLTDNGSLRPEATVQLRALARQLSARVDHEVEPVSLLHSHKIPAERLSGRSATIVKRRLRECFRSGKNDFVVLPLFLGPSLAITDYLPKIVRELKAECPDLRLRIAAPLAGESVLAPDSRLARILADQLARCSACDQIALVDHGTPIEPVNTLRNAVARQLAERIGRPVQPCSMERRAGAEYAFNEPLLERLGALPDFSGSRLKLSMFFLLPGRHAGPSGDVRTIADGLIAEGAFERIAIAPLMGEHPLILEILADRLAAALGR